MISRVTKTYLSWFMLLSVLLQIGWSGTTQADELVPLRLVAMLSQDDQGEKIGFPYALHYDPWAEETYLISNTGRVTIYNNKYFPIASFGRGRGLSNINSLTVDRQGVVYICQGKDREGRKARLSLYNQAFFLIREIIFENIPELVDFAPQRIAVAQTGEIYLAGNLGADTFNAAVVLSNEGKFLRFLYPGENDSTRPLVTGLEKSEQKLPVETASVDSPGEAIETPSVPSGEAPELEGPPGDLPEGIRPAKSSAPADLSAEAPEKFYPARITTLDIDENGRIYLVSREASHIYVYNAQEQYLFKFGVKGGVESKLSNAVALAVDYPRRIIYVCDYMRHTILCYDYDSGSFVYEFGGRGLGPLWFNFPSDVTVDVKGNVVVADQFNRRLQVINPNMAERRPLVANLPPPLTGGQQPAPESQKTPVSTPEPESAKVAPPLAQSEPDRERPLPLAQASGQPVIFGSPGQISAASLPALAPKLIVPRYSKKIVDDSERPVLTLSRMTPAMIPATLVAPAGVRVMPLRAARSSPGPESLHRLMSMPAAVGVYGPVVSLLGIGGWLLYAKAS